MLHGNYNIQIMDFPTNKSATSRENAISEKYVKTYSYEKKNAQLNCTINEFLALLRLNIMSATLLFTG